MQRKRSAEEIVPGVGSRRLNDLPQLQELTSACIRFFGGEPAQIGLAADFDDVLGLVPRLPRLTDED